MYSLLLFCNIFQINISRITWKLAILNWPSGDVVLNVPFIDDYSFYALRISFKKDKNENWIWVLMDSNHSGIVTFS
jgi:hypothetical protein